MASCGLIHMSKRIRRTARIRVGFSLSVKVIGRRCHPGLAGEWPSITTYRRPRSKAWTNSDGSPGPAWELAILATHLPDITAPGGPVESHRPGRPLVRIPSRFGVRPTETYSRRTRDGLTVGNLLRSPIDHPKTARRHRSHVRRAPPGARTSDPLMQQTELAEFQDKAVCS